VPTLNEGSLLGMTIESILSQTAYPNYEVIVVVDGSTDGSCAALAPLDGRVRVISSEGLGVARARNLGAAFARGEYVVFLDAHCRVSPNWLTGLAAALAPSDVGVAGPCFTRLHEPEPRGCGMMWPDLRLDPTWFMPAPTQQPYAVPLTTGACQAFRLATFKTLGCYEEGFTSWGFEDVEICLRAWLLGYRVVANPLVMNRAPKGGGLSLARQPAWLSPRRTAA
jgi:glycosyltransferase involved in cell wall biosynthesis